MAKVNELRSTSTRPPQDLVILRERELGGELVNAIRRVRADATTQNSRILVIAADDATEAASTPPVHDTVALARRAAETRALQAAGERIQPLTADLRHLFGEATRALAELDAELEGGPRVGLRHRARSLAGVLEWVEAVTHDLELEAAACVAGRQPVDLVEVLAEAGAALERRRPGVRVHVTPAEGHGEWPAVESACLAEFCAAALDLVAERIGGQGAIQASVALDRTGVTVRLLGVGEKHRVRGGGRIQALRRLAARIDARLFADPASGPTGTGFGFTLGNPA